MLIYYDPMKSFILLGTSLIKLLFLKMTKDPSKDGAETFIELYRPDGLSPRTLEDIERDLFWAGCIDCGHCDRLNLSIPAKIAIINKLHHELENLDHPGFNCPVGITFENSW